MQLHVWPWERKAWSSKAGYSGFCIFILQEMGPLSPSKQESLLNSPNLMPFFADRPQALLPLECRVSLSPLVAMTKCLAKQLKGRRTCLVSQFEGRAHHWGLAWSHWSHRLLGQQAERGECYLLSWLLPSLPLI